MSDVLWDARLQLVYDRLTAIMRRRPYGNAARTLAVRMMWRIRGGRWATGASY